MTQEKSKTLFSSILLSLYLISFISGISLGLFNPLISTFMGQRQINNVLIGANSTTYFLAIALGSLLVVEKLLESMGIRRTIMFGLLLTGTSAPLFVLTTDLSLWFFIRVIMGVGVCCFLVGGQTALNHFADEQNRASINGLHALAFIVGFGIGPIIGTSLYTLSPFHAFTIGGALILSGLVIAWQGLPDQFLIFSPQKTGVFKKIKLPLHGIFVCGFAEATLVSLYPLFLLEQNYGVQQIGYVFSIFVLGGILSTLPVTYLADRLGKTKIFALILAIELCATLGIILTQQFHLTLLFSFLVGVGLGPIFPLCLALIGDKLKEHELPSGSAFFTTVYSTGSAAGPILSSIMMSLFGSNHVFSLCLPLYVSLLFHIKKTQSRKKYS